MGPTLKLWWKITLLILIISLTAIISLSVLLGSDNLNERKISIDFKSQETLTFFNTVFVLFWHLFKSLFKDLPCAYGNHIGKKFPTNKYLISTATVNIWLHIYKEHQRRHALCCSTTLWKHLWFGSINTSFQKQYSPKQIIIPLHMLIKYQNKLI